MSLLRLPSFGRLGIREPWAWITFFHGWGCKMPYAVLLFTPGVLNHLTFFLPPLKFLFGCIWCYFQGL